ARVLCCRAHAVGVGTLPFRIQPVPCRCGLRCGAGGISRSLLLLGLLTLLIGKQALLFGLLALLLGLLTLQIGVLALLLGQQALLLRLQAPIFLCTRAVARVVLALECRRALLFLVDLFLSLQRDDPRVLCGLCRLPRRHHDLVSVVVALAGFFRIGEKPRGLAVRVGGVLVCSRESRDLHGVACLRQIERHAGCRRGPFHRGAIGVHQIRAALE